MGYWDTVVVGELGKDARAILTRLTGDITPERAAEWSKGDFASWGKETNAVAALRYPCRFSGIQQDSVHGPGFRL